MSEPHCIIMGFWFFYVQPFALFLKKFLSLFLAVASILSCHRYSKLLLCIVLGKYYLDVIFGMIRVLSETACLCKDKFVLNFLMWFFIFTIILFQFSWFVSSRPFCLRLIVWLLLIGTIVLFPWFIVAPDGFWSFKNNFVLFALVFLFKGKSLNRVPIVKFMFHLWYLVILFIWYYCFGWY